MRRPWPALGCCETHTHTHRERGYKHEKCYKRNVKPADNIHIPYITHYTLEEVMKTQKGNKGIDLLFL